MRWTERQRAMLGAMGITLWAPAARDGTGDATQPPAAQPARPRFFTGPYQRRSIPVIGHNVPQEAPAAVAEAVLELL